MPTATLIKSFKHDGRQYKEGDQYEGSEGDLELLARQGFIKPPGEEPVPAASQPDAHNPAIKKK